MSDLPEHPGGLTCEDCRHHLGLCSWLLAGRFEREPAGEARTCDWLPSRFVTIWPYPGAKEDAA